MSGTDGAVLQSYEYTENGEKTVTLDGGIQNWKTWVGGHSVQDETADTDLYLMGHRWYSASAGGRFLSRDPIGFAGGMNLYSYASSSPVMMVDAAGLNPGTMGFRPSVAVGIGLENVGGTGALDLSIGLQAINNSYTEGRMFVKVEGFDDPIILGKDGKARYGRDTTPEEIDLFMAGGRGDRMRDTPCPPAGHRFSLTDLPSSSPGPWHKSGGNWPDHAIFQFGLGNLYHSPTNPRYNRIRISVSFIGTAVFSDTSVGPVRPAGRSMTHEFRIEGPVRDVRHGEL